MVVLNTKSPVVALSQLLLKPFGASYEGVIGNPDAAVIDIDHALAETCRQSGRCLYLDLNSTIAPTGAIPDFFRWPASWAEELQDMGEHFDTIAQQ
jgi:hypothetical protein